jgi:putative lipoprotein
LLAATMKTFPAFLALLAILAAPAAPAQEAKPADNTPRLAYGFVLKQGERIVFSPCRDRSYAMVEDISVERAVTAMLNSVGLDAGRKLYVELFAVVEGGALKASGLNLARTEGRCQRPGGADEAWQAGGNEPGWNLAAGGDKVVVKRLGKPDVVLPYAPFASAGSVTRYEVVQGSHRLALRFDRKTCHDTMADAVFGWVATVSLDGQTFTGCAWQR